MKFSVSVKFSPNVVNECHSPSELRSPFPYYLLRKIAHLCLINMGVWQFFCTLLMQLLSRSSRSQRDVSTAVSNMFETRCKFAGFLRKHTAKSQLVYTCHLNSQSCQRKITVKCDNSLPCKGSFGSSPIFPPSLARKDCVTSLKEASSISISRKKITSGTKDSV